MDSNDKRIMEMKRFIDRSGALIIKRPTVSSKDLLAVGEFAKQDLYGAIFLAIAYGMACGYQATEVSI